LIAGRRDGGIRFRNSMAARRPRKRPRGAAWFVRCMHVIDDPQSKRME